MTALVETDALKDLSLEEKRALLAKLLRQRTEQPKLYPASLAQRRLWFISTLAPDSPAYNIPCPVRLSGPLDTEALAWSFQQVVLRHQTLRSSLVTSEDDSQPLQRVVGQLEISMPIQDLASKNGTSQDLRTTILEESMAPFDISQGPLIRLLLLRLAPDEHVLVLTLHHLIADGWSQGVLVREIVTFYAGYRSGADEARTLLPPLEIQYTDFARWQKEWLLNGEMERQTDWWKEQLQGQSPSLNLPFDRPRPARMQENGAMLYWDLPQSLVKPLEAFAHDLQATLFMVLLATFGGLLQRYTGQRDLSVGTPIANRTRSQTENLIGLFVNTLVLRFPAAPGNSFETLVHAVRETTVGAYAHQDVPFEKLVEELQPQRDLSRSPLFEVMFELQNAPLPKIEIKDLTLEILDLDRSTARFDLTVGFRPTDQGLKGWAEYSTDLFDRTTIQRLAQHLNNLLRAVAEDPKRALSDLPLLTRAERHQLSEWNDSTQPYDRDATVERLLTRQLRRTPESIAACCYDAALSFQEIHQRADQVAGRLVNLGAGPDVAVGLLADRSLEYLIATLAIWKAGAIYLPLEPTHPDQRVGKILAATRPPVLVVAGAAQEKAQSLRGLDLPTPFEVLCLEKAIETSAPKTSAPTPRVDADHLAYLIFTSGSTGIPKGVMIHHRGFVNDLLARIDAFNLSSDDTMAQTASHSFDISVWQLVVTLLIGGQVRLYPDEISKDPNYLGAELLRHRVSIFENVPSMLREMLPEEPGGASSLRNLRWLMPTGEALPPDLCRALYRACPHVPMMNAYGPAECSDDVTLHPIREELEGNIVPIGRPLQNYRIHLLDRQLAEVPIGIAGQIWVAGDGVGRGYCRAPAKTAVAFAPDPFTGGIGERMYASGDLGRLMNDGTLEFLGRVDHQIKIRGFRIELEEIESVLLKHPAIREAVVLACDLSPTDRRLVAYITFRKASGPPELSDLRAYLTESVPVYMVPSAFVILDALPLSANGKVDRGSLRPPSDDDFERRDTRRRPEGPTEELLASIWSEILKLDAVGVDENFFDLGGHSLLASQVVARIRVAFRVEIPIFSIFEQPTIVQLSKRIDDALIGGEKLEIEPILPVPRDQDLPLSFAQERLWFLDQLDVDSVAYNLPTALDVQGRLNPCTLSKTFSEMVRRHEVLRTVFETSDGLSRQKILPPAPVPLPLVDLSGLPTQSQARARAERLRADATRPFALTTGPVLRTTLLRFAPDHHLLLLTVHHIAADGWSLGIFIQEFLAVYKAFSNGQETTLPELDIQYADYAVWQRQQLDSGILERQLNYWRRQLADAAPVFDLPRRHSAETHMSGDIRRFRLPAELGSRLRRLSLENGATLFMTLFAGFETLLYRYTQQKDIVLGTPTANRNRPEIEKLIGFLVNTLALRGDLSGNPTFLTFLNRVRQTCLEAFAHQDLPFEQLVAELNPERTLDRGPIFQMMFSLQNEPQSLIEIPGLTFELLDTFNEEPMFELLLDIIEEGDDGNQLLCLLVYRSDLFESTLIDRFEKHFGNLLESMVQNPTRRLNALDLLSAGERQQILLEWNDSRCIYRSEHHFSTFFAEAVARQPDRLAARCGDESLTYAQLDTHAGRLAHALRERAVGPESRAAIFGHRNLEFLVAIVAVFEAGAAYVPLDPHHPSERHRHILDQAQPEVLLITPGGGPAASAGSLAELPQLEVVLSAADSIPQRRPVSPRFPDLLAYIIFTSGSTGLPKGAMVTQRGLVNHILGFADACHLDDRDVLAQTASQCFDISVWQFLAPLMLGGRVAIYPDTVAHNPVRLGERIQSDGVTVLEQVPSFLRAMLNEEERLGVRRLGKLRWMIPTGEALPPELARRWEKTYPQVPFLNAYGPAECSDDVTLQLINAQNIPPGGQAPIGRPMSNIEVRVLNPDLWPVSIEVSGEIFIGGIGVGRGYTGDPQRTAAAFLPDPFSTEPGQRIYATGDLGRLLADGALEFVGRVDHQVKIRGLRIELGEIESVLGDHSVVSEAVVLVQGTEANARLVAFVTLDPAASVPPDGLSRLLVRDLKQILPEYMVPATFQALAEMPRTANGKIDRKTLDAMELDEAIGETVYVAPENEVEEFLVELYEEIFARDLVGIYDNFFDLGGHSLLATQVVSRVIDAFAIDLTLRQFFEAPTVAELASAIERLVIEDLEQLSDEEIDVESFA